MNVEEGKFQEVSIKKMPMSVVWSIGQTQREIVGQWHYPNTVDSRWWKGTDRTGHTHTQRSNFSSLKLFNNYYFRFPDKSSPSSSFFPIHISSFFNKSHVHIIVVWWCFSHFLWIIPDALYVLFGKLFYSFITIIVVVDVVAVVSPPLQ